MSWICRLVEFDKTADGHNLQVGDMFYGPTLEEVQADNHLPLHESKGWWWPWAFCKPVKLSDYYRANNSHRRPLLIFMPGRVLWCIDGVEYEHGIAKNTHGWKVTGDAPKITLLPSIDMGSIYHGYITNGVITDDVCGRRYDRRGLLI